jgi:hypothetical protein
MQNLHQPTWDHEILYVNRSSKDEQLPIRIALGGKKRCVEGMNVKINVLFTETTQEPLHFIQMKSGRVKDH